MDNVKKLIIEKDSDIFVKSDGLLDESGDEDENDRQHEKLLDAITSLSSKHKVTGKQRTEHVKSASEFHASGNEGKLELQELVGAIQSSSSNAELKKHLKKIEKQEKVLAVPLPKHEKEKIERTVAYEQTCTDLKKWDPVIQSNRKADQLQFPLQQPDIRLINNTRQSLKTFQPRTPLEMEVAALLHGSDNVLRNDQVLTTAEKKALKVLSLEEAKARRAELQKHRALLSYKEAKSKRAKKIKSKRYHRILRKEKLKLEKKTLEELEKTDPEGYLEKLQQMDKQRMQERMNLKHRGGSKYMKRQAIYSKFDDGARQAVQDMVQKNKELTQKLTQEEEEEDEEEIVMATDDNIHNKASATDDGHNPWMSVTGGRKKYSATSRLQEVVNTEAVIQNAQQDEEQQLDTENGLEMTQNKESVEEDSDMNGEVADSIFDNESETVEMENDNVKDVEEYGTIDDIFKKAEKEKLKVKQLEKKVKRQLAKEKREKLEARRLEKRAEMKKQQKLKEKAEKKSKKKADSDDSDSSDMDSDDAREEDQDDAADDKPDEEGGLMPSLVRKNKMEDFEGTVHVDKVLTYTPDLSYATKKVSGQPSGKKSGNQSKEVRLDPDKYFTVESVKHAEVTELVEEGEEDEMVGEDQQRLTIAQAFASDDIVEEFKAEKKEIEKRDKPKDIDLTLPGWGEWGGEGVQPSKKKRRRFRIKAPDAPPRKDRNLSNVIISETKDNSIAPHQVSQLPFPFTSVHEFQNSIRQPIGRTWNPETSYKEMIQPRVTTKLGTIIDPISKEQTFKNSKDKLNTDDAKAKKEPERTAKSNGNQNRKRKKQAK